MESPFESFAVRRRILISITTFRLRKAADFWHLTSDVWSRLSLHGFSPERRRYRTFRSYPARAAENMQISSVTFTAPFRPARVVIPDDQQYVLL
jgi:hypothetical protein